MKSIDQNKQEEEHLFLQKFGYLDILKKYKKLSIDDQNISMKDFITKLHIIVFGCCEKSDKKMVNEAENILTILAINSIRIQDKQELSKILSLVFSEAFDIFISTLKEEKSVSFSEFQKKIFNLLDIDNISKSLNLEASEVTKVLDITQYKKVIKKFKKKPHKLSFIVLMFYRDFIEKNDSNICGELNKYLKANEISEFYKIYDKIIDENIRIKNENNIDSQTQKEKENNTKDKTKEESENNENLIKTNYASSQEDKLENWESDSSKNIEQEEINKIKNSINSHDQANNETFNDTIKLLTQQFEEFQKKSTKDKQELLEQIEKDKQELLEKNQELTQKIEELQKNSTKDKEELTQKIEELQEESTKDKKELKNLKDQMKEMSNETSKNINNLNEKLDLLVLINNLICQRDTYKIALEELIKFLTERYGITINDINTNEPIWKKTKAICILLSKSDTIEKDNCQKIINGLKSLLFCKDYFNCIVHPKSAFANEKESSSELTNNLPILSIACYKSMKELTQKFFDSVVNSIGDFKKVNSLLLKKIKFWTDAKDFNYEGYFEKEILNTRNIMDDFKFVINFIEENNIVEKIEDSLDN